MLCNSIIEVCALVRLIKRDQKSSYKLYQGAKQTTTKTIYQLNVTIFPICLKHDELGNPQDTDCSQVISVPIENWMGLTRTCGRLVRCSPLSYWSTGSTAYPRSHSSQSNPRPHPPLSQHGCAANGRSVVQVVQNKTTTEKYFTVVDTCTRTLNIVWVFFLFFF